MSAGTPLERALAPLVAHRERVAALERAFARLLQLHQELHDAHNESWTLLSGKHQVDDRDAKVAAVRERLLAQRKEIAALRREHFGVTDATAAALIGVPDAAPPPLKEEDFPT